MKKKSLTKPSLLAGKASSLLLILVVYVVAFVAGGIFVYFTMGVLHPLLAVFLADVIATVIVYVLNLCTHNASVYDPYWSVQPPFVVLAFYMLGAPFQPVQLLTLVPLCIWAVRLTVNWARYFENLAWQDWRYGMFKTNFPRISELIVFTGIMMFPTLLVYAGCVPFWFLFTSAPSALWCAAGGVIILLGTGLELFADRQMTAFKHDREQGTAEGLVINRGLWKRSRHPNYCGEMLIWIGVMVSSLNNITWLNFAGAVLMILLFTCISIPMMEKHMIGKSPKYAAAYGEYRSSVRMLF
jgi:steroid 5-alpha reductase family enzyme